LVRSPATGPVMATSHQKEGREALRTRRAVGRAEQALAELDRVLLSGDSLCASDLSILDRLSRKGPQAVNDLGRRIGLTSGSITTAVQRLRAKGLVESLRNSEDRRIVSVSATPAGSEVANRLLKERRAALHLIFDQVSTRERDLLLGLLKRLRKATEDHLDQHSRMSGTA
jgi:MarR family transcriptional regulator, 2-MHQ and catechol-resistance regulon repressor